MPMNSGVKIWSKTAASNGAVDATINWSEGQAPSTVNDSARSMMSRLADFRDDISGTITTAGTSTNYTLTTNQGFTTLAEMDGAMIAFIPHATSAVSCTMSVNGLSGCYVRTATGTYMPEGVLVAGTPYVATFKSATNEFLLHNLSGANTYNIPLGGMLDYAGVTSPNSAFALPYGQAISRTNYASLFTLIGQQYGSGDGSTTFNLPDLRGRGSVCPDNMGGTTANRLLNGSMAGVRHTPGGTGGTDTITLDRTQIPTGIVSSGNNAIAVTPGGGLTGVAVTSTPANVTASGTTPGGALSVPGSTSGSWGGTSTFTGNNNISVTSNNTGGLAHDNMPPSIILPKLMRII